MIAAIPGFDHAVDPGFDHAVDPGADRTPALLPSYRTPALLPSYRTPALLPIELHVARLRPPAFLPSYRPPAFLPSYRPPVLLPIELHVARLRPPPPAPSPWWLDMRDDLEALSLDELARAAGYASAWDARRFLAGRAILRRRVGARLGLEAAAVPLATDRGRPVVERGSGTVLPPSVSVTHAGDLVVVAIADSGFLGVDVEVIDDSLSPGEMASIAASVLGAPDDEAGTDRDVPERQARLTFLLRWTATEAILKALGTGFLGEPGGVQVDIEGNRPVLRRAPGVTPAEIEGWALVPFRVAPRHVGCLALAPPAPVAIAAAPA